MQKLDFEFIDGTKAGCMVDFAIDHSDGQLFKVVDYDSLYDFVMCAVESDELVERVADSEIRLTFNEDGINSLDISTDEGDSMIATMRVEYA